VRQRIEEKLKKNFRIKFLEVKNNSQLHHGHLGSNGSGETHFALIIAAEELEKVSLIQAHRKINSLLKNEFEGGVHALEIKILK
jgi:BolA protein